MHPLEHGPTPVSVTKRVVYTRRNVVKTKLTRITAPILGLSLLAVLDGRPGNALGAEIYKGPWIIPWDKDASKMTIMVETDGNVDDNFNERRIHFTYDTSTCGKPNWSWSCSATPFNTGWLFRINAV
jgi:hypothetical protein